MVIRPSPAWYATGIRWIASELVSFANTLDRRAPEPWPLEPAPEYHPIDDYLLEARHRASRAL